MIDNEYFLDNDKLFYKKKDYIYLYSDVDAADKSTELIINDNDNFSKNMALNRNLSVLRNKLHLKYDYSNEFGLADITTGPTGFILMSDGPGTVPYWESPERILSSLKTVEVVDKETFLIDYMTYDTSLFSSINNVSIVNNSLKFTADGSITLKPFTINKTGEYQVYIELTPIELIFSKLQSGVIYVKDINLNPLYTYIVSTDMGDIILRDVTITSYATESKIFTTTQINTVYKVYMVNILLNLDIYSTSRNYKVQHFDDLLLSYGKLYLYFTRRECSGNILEFSLTCNSGIAINKIRIDLYTTEFLG